MQYRKVIYALVFPNADKVKGQCNSGKCLVEDDLSDAAEPEAAGSDDEMRVRRARRT